jgi:outer membrane lipoprotein-sorting protein
MSKFLWSGIAIALISSIGIAQAQLPPNSKPPTLPSQPASPTSTPIKATDLPLLKRAIGKILQTDRAETESQIEINSSDEKGKKSKYFISVKTIAQVGGKFHSELTINRVGEKSIIKYNIISNGTKIWIYRPDLRQYKYRDFYYSQPLYCTIGLFSGAFSGLSDVQRQELITDILGENGRIIPLSVKPLERVQVSQQQIDKEILSVYTDERDDNNRINGYYKERISGFINSKTAMLERIELKFTDNHSQDLMRGKIIKYNRIEITEKIIKRNSQPRIAAKTFTFSPPKGVKKVTSLQIGPFEL